MKEKITAVTASTQRRLRTHSNLAALQIGEMNNTQFRNLLLDKSSGQNDGGSNAKSSASPSNLGTKRASFMPMTPRTVKGSPDVDFARQVRERNAALKPMKKFKTAQPKGVKYGAGYTDRAKARAEEDEASGADDKAGRIKALEEQMKLGQISQETFEALREEITGGDVASTHLVKGLDRKLLERVRRGEDVLGVGGGEEGAEQPPDIEEELDKLGDMEVQAVKREKNEKKGSMAPPPPVAGVKRSRDEIMAELKAQRIAAAQAKAAPVLDSRWRKVGAEKDRIKVDHKGRQVVITVDKDGVVKKKVRKLPRSEADQDKAVLDMPDESKPILGSDAVMPEAQKAEAVDDEDDDIFEGVGTAYDPLGDEDDNDNSDEEDSEDKKPSPPERQPAQARSPEPSDESIETTDAVPKATPRNYFNDTVPTTEEAAQDRMVGVQELLKKASKMDSAHAGETKSDGEESDGEQEKRLKKRAQMLAQQDRDLDDMDLGFGSSRYDDGEDEGEDAKIRLSEWKGSGHAADDDGQGGGKGGGNKKTRKPKKRKGDANNMADIMRVIDGRKAGSGK